MVISPDTHSFVTVPRIVSAALCMLELVDVTCHLSNARVD